jgi:hypothetical protein
MESCPSYKPWLDKSNGHVFLRRDTGKCLHYYFYFIDEEFGLCYLRAPTWAPFGLQFYRNGPQHLPSGACSVLPTSAVQIGRWSQPEALQPSPPVSVGTQVPRSRTALV